MKKILFMAALLMAGVSTVFGQTEKGKIMLNGSSDLTFLSMDKKKKYVEEDDRITDSSDIKNFGFNASASYFVVDNLALGFGLLYDSEKEEDKEADLKDKTFMVGPMARYYFGSSNIKPFVNGSLMFGSMKQEELYDNESYVEKYKSFGWELGAGAAFFLKDNISIDLGLSYAFKEHENKDDSKQKTEIDGLAVKVGFSLFF